MSDDDLNDYFKNRFKDQVDWYSKKAKSYKKKYHFIQVLIIILSGVLPVMLWLHEKYSDIYPQLIIFLFVSPAIVILTSLQSHFKYHDLWVEYRTTAETLKKEEFFYQSRINDYDIDDRDARTKVFVHRVESLISRQNKTWVARYDHNDDNQSN